MVSLLPSTPLPLREGPGAVTTKELHVMVAWFCATFKHKALHVVRVHCLTIPCLYHRSSTFRCPAQDLAAPDADVELPPARGVQGFVDMLLAAAAAQEGSAEELCALMVSLLRCHNQLARTVRCALYLSRSPMDACTHNCCRITFLPSVYVHTCTPCRLKSKQQQQWPPTTQGMHPITPSAKEHPCQRCFCSSQERDRT